MAYQLHNVRNGRGNTTSNIGHAHPETVTGDAAFQRTRPHTVKLPRPDNFWVPFR